MRYRQFHPDWKAQDIRHCLDLLQRAGLAFPVLHSSAEGLPLGAGEDPTAEQFTAQHLAAAQTPAQRSKLHYWLREGKSSNAELDFLLPSGSSIIPIEVKSGSSGSLRSLHQFMADRPGGLAVRLDLNAPSSQEIRTTVMSPDGKRQVGYRLLNLPLYMAGRLLDLGLEA